MNHITLRYTSQQVNNITSHIISALLILLCTDINFKTTPNRNLKNGVFSTIVKHAIPL